METNKKYGVVLFSESDRPELEQFARWFHQDWDIMGFPSFDHGVMTYLTNLAALRRLVLKAEIAKFLAKHKDNSKSQWRKAWMKLGAQMWPVELDLRDALQEYHDRM